MMYYNKIILIGNLTSNPEPKSLSNGKVLVNFGLAVKREGKGENAKTDFINCTAWDERAETIAQHLTKGRNVMIEGQLRIEKYEKEGITKQNVFIEVNNFKFNDAKKDSPN